MQEIFKNIEEHASCFLQDVSHDDLLDKNFFDFMMDSVFESYRKTLMKSLDRDIEARIKIAIKRMPLRNVSYLLVRDKEHLFLTLKKDLEPELPLIRNHLAKLGIHLVRTSDQNKLEFTISL